ncbi:MAG: hypothetical protein RSD39_00865 [Oscillospiraceae bacterium]
MLYNTISQPLICHTSAFFALIVAFALPVLYSPQVLQDSVGGKRSLFLYVKYLCFVPLQGHFYSPNNRALEKYRKDAAMDTARLLNQDSGGGKPQLFLYVKYLCFVPLQGHFYSPNNRALEKYRKDTAMDTAFFSMGIALSNLRAQPRLKRLRLCLSWSFSARSRSVSF